MPYNLQSLFLQLGTGIGGAGPGGISLLAWKLVPPSVSQSKSFLSVLACNPGTGLEAAGGSVNTARQGVECPWLASHRDKGESLPLSSCAEGGDSRVYSSKIKYELKEERNCGLPITEE